MGGGRGRGQSVGTRPNPARLCASIHPCVAVHAPQQALATHRRGVLGHSTPQLPLPHVQLPLPHVPFVMPFIRMHCLPACTACTACLCRYCAQLGVLRVDACHLHPARPVPPCAWGSLPLQHAVHAPSTLPNPTPNVRKNGAPVQKAPPRSSCARAEGMCCAPPPTHTPTCTRTAPYYPRTPQAATSPLHP